MPRRNAVSFLPPSFASELEASVQNGRIEVNMLMQNANLNWGEARSDTRPSHSFTFGRDKQLIVGGYYFCRVALIDDMDYLPGQ